MRRVGDIARVVQLGRAGYIFRYAAYVRIQANDVTDHQTSLKFLLMSRADFDAMTSLDSYDASRLMRQNGTGYSTMDDHLTTAKPKEIAFAQAAYALNSCNLVITSEPVTVSNSSPIPSEGDNQCDH